MMLALASTLALHHIRRSALLTAGASRPALLPAATSALSVLHSFERLPRMMTAAGVSASGITLHVLHRALRPLALVPSLARMITGAARSSSGRD